jgi:ADP-heptose:LPS heptosyltransferase
VTDAPSLPEPGDSDVIARYRKRYRFARLLINTLDSTLRLFIHSRLPPPITRPHRILLANYGHLGDVVMSTVCLTILQQAWPDVEIGFLIGSWSRPVLEGHPDVARLHIVDHWFMDRGPANRPLKAMRYWSASRRVAGEIRQANYDVAIDLRAYRPNAIPVLWLAGVPVRIGYTSVGFGPLLTHPQQFVFQRRHESAVQSDLLRMLPIPKECLDSPVFRLSPATANATREVDVLLASKGWSGQPFIVIHMAASVPVRDWPTANWQSLTKRLAAEGRRVILTGRGRRDRSLIERVVAGLPDNQDGSILNACDKLSFAGLVELIRRAEIVFSVETMAGHIAAAVGTPCVAIYGGMSDPKQWAPRPGPDIRVVTHVVPCWPCFQYNGCAEMSCLRDLPVEDVIAAEESLNGRR